MKIEVIYRDSNGNVVDKKKLSKEDKISSPRIRTLIKDQYGFQYKSKKSKNSEVKVSYIEPIKKEKTFHYSEDELYIKTFNDKYSISFNKKTNNAEISSVIPPSLVKNFEKGKTSNIKTILLALEDIQAVKEDEDLLDVLVKM